MNGRPAHQLATSSILSMSFSGGSYYRSGTIAALTNLDYSNFGFSLDV